MIEIIYLVIAIIILAILSPFILHITNLFVDIIPEQLLTIMAFALAVKIVLFLIHRGDEG